MKKSELRQLIKEEIANITERSRLSPTNPGANLTDAFLDLRFTIFNQLGSLDDDALGVLSDKEVMVIGKEISQLEKHLKNKLKGKGIKGW